MDYLADLTVKESCSILEQTTPTKNGGTASCRSAVSFGSEEEEGRGRNRDFEENGEDGRGWDRTLRGRKRNRGGRKRDFEEEGNGTWRRKKQ